MKRIALVPILVVVTCVLHGTAKAMPHNRTVADGPFAGSFANVVGSLPGLEFEPNFDQYSGYVYWNGSRMYFWFVEAEHEIKAVAPLSLWMTGGPGCSGLLGMMFENGPYVVSADGLKLKKRQYSWTKLASVIYLEQPAGVGFSWNVNASYVSGDNVASEANYQFLLGFFQLFPELLVKPFFIAGESYAGHYIPQLALRIVQGMDENPIALRGLSAGNPCTAAAIEAQSYIPFMFQHTMISTQVYDAAFTACDGVFSHPSHGLCAELLHNITMQDLYYINPYSIDKPCAGDGPSPEQGCFTQSLALALAHGQAPRSQTFVPCLELNNIAVYLNQPGVRNALYVDSHSNAWDVCSADLVYNQYAESVVEIYQAIAGKTIAGQPLRVLIYSGDMDSCVNVLGTQAAVVSFGLEVVEPWRAWTISVNNMTQAAGFVEAYAQSTAFATVKGAGHMVFHYEPQAGFEMMQRFYAGASL